MPRTHHPRRGSKAYAPRKRAKRIYSSFKTHPQTKAGVGEFAAYKVGMTQLSMIDDRKGSPTFNQLITVPVTILEAPPIKVVGVRAYAKTINGFQPVKEVWSSADKTLSKKIPLQKNPKANIGEIEKIQDKISDLRLIVYTQPSKAGIGKKAPELFEVAVGGTIQEKMNFAKEKLGKDLNVNEAFKEGQMIDAIAVTKGKGFQGSIKRFGLKRLPHKSQKIRRKVGTLGPWHPHKVRWTVPQMGQMGFFSRLELNKRILRISEAKDLVNKAGWKNYGVVKSTCILIKGSLPGTTKRLVMLRQAARARAALGVPTIEQISLRQ